MADYESLLEFEECLRQSNPKDTSITLNNLATKIEYNLVVPNPDEKPKDEAVELDPAINNYDYKNDEFTTCNTCGQSIASDDVKDCYKRFIEESKISSGLEKSFWLSFLDNPTRTINTLPNYSQVLFLQQGMIFQIRALVWRKLFLISFNNQIPEASLLVYRNFQHSYNSETSEQISKDLTRTFPTIKFFQKDENIQELETVLNVYANYDVELGYCQGLLFLVGTLHYQFKDPELTFHALITIMESEVELHDIFTTSLMSVTLNNWVSEFNLILSKIDHELYTHLTKLADVKAFLFQWWLSFMSSHTPDFSIINRIMDFCLIQGWKVGMFKISLGLLIANKPILMSLNEGDEDVIYQHLLNESKWGLVIKDINSFFGELLFEWDSKLFTKSEDIIISKPMKSHKRTQSSMVDKFKSLNISANSFYHSNHSALSVFSKNNHPHNKANNDNELDSIYSDITYDSSNSANSSSSKFVDYLKLPIGSSTPPKFYNEDHSKSNKYLKLLLAQCLQHIDDDESAADLKQEIAQALN